MNTIHVLDCTLRDGGYVNNWEFGFQNAREMTDLIAKTGVSYVELGFIGNYPDIEGNLRFSRMESLCKQFIPTRPSTPLAALTYVEGYPVTNIPKRSDKTVDMVRVIFWKRNFDEGLEYCKELANRGYEVSVQLARTDQFSIDEIGGYLYRLNEAHPVAVYIADSFGTYSKEKLISYAEQYDKNLAPNVRMGYHAHNNLQQAFLNAVTFAEHEWHHELMIDASVLGMGRGAGNLNLEVFLNYMNNTLGYNFDLNPFNIVVSKYLNPIYEKLPWGYSMPFFLAAISGRNHSYVKYLIDKGVSEEDMDKIFKKMEAEDTGIVFKPEVCDQIMKELNIQAK